MIKACLFDMGCILVCPDQGIVNTGGDALGDTIEYNRKQDSIDILGESDGYTGISPMDGLRRVEDRMGSFWTIPYSGKTHHLLPGVINFLKELRHNGMKLGFTSDDPKDLNILSKTGIRGMFDAIVDSRLLTCPRPCSEALCQVAGKLGVEPSECVVFEGTPEGIESARCAGMRSVAVGDSSIWSHADMGIVSLKDFSYRELADRIEQPHYSC